MTNKIYYGHHLFPYGPEPYIKTNNLGIKESHKNIIRALITAFSNEIPNSILSQLAGKFNFDLNSSVNLSFMNYGNTQLVYLATIADKFKFAVLINQPHTHLGVVKEEFNNLEHLVKIDQRFVVKPFAYFDLKEKGHELYASQYIDNARCIAVNNYPGFYDPLPFYHFEKFLPETVHAINSNIISLFVNYYDSEKKRGIAKTQISGDDFILTQNFIKNKSDTIQPNIKIIAARGFIEASLDEYINLLRQEFLIGTNYDEKDIISGKIRINHKSKLPMNLKEIEKGIQIGLELRKQHKL